MVRTREAMLMQSRLPIHRDELSGTEGEEGERLVDCRNCFLCSVG